MSLLRILLLEDDPSDAELIRANLEADQIVCDLNVVKTRVEFLTGLKTQEIDLVLADYKLPSFDGLSALKLSLSIRPDLPFIFVSGTFGEESAIEALKIGATDYVLKTRLSKLVPAVRRALREKEERQKAEDALRQLQEQARLLDLTHDAIFVWDMNRVIRYWNRGAEALYGWTAEQVVGRPGAEFLKTVFPVPFERIKEELLSAGRWEGELVRTKSDGTQISVAGRWSLQRDAHGKPVATLETNNDITDRKRADGMQTELAHANRVATLGQLSASITHEVSQPIAGVATNVGAALRWLGHQPPDVERALRALSGAAHSTERAREILTGIRALVAKAPKQKEPFEINEAIHEVIMLAQAEIRKNGISIVMELGEGLPRLLGDRIQLQQVMLNLINNAVQAMSAAGVEPRELVIVTSKADRDGIVVAVRDSGPGLDPASPERVFDAFYTTKPDGLGIGLSVCRSIIEAHGGRLWASTNKPRGATFQFTVPA
jgi:two-component system, LuxR family, sensor kinase FixL